MPLKNLKASNPIELAEYTIAILRKVRSKYWDITHKFGIRLPKTVDEALAIDKETGAFIGQAGILQKELEGEIVHEVGYSIKPRFWRKGYATEMALKLKAFAEEHKVNSQVISIIHIDNIGSQKVARNNGMDILRKTTYREMPVYIFGVNL